jgi:hypothetical protein
VPVTAIEIHNEQRRRQLSLRNVFAGHRGFRCLIPFNQLPRTF